MSGDPNQGPGPGPSADGIAAELGEFVADLTVDDLPDDVVDTAERAVLDTVGVTLAGSETDVARAAVATESGTGGEATVLGRDRQLPLTGAVFANATAGHALDYDDVALEVMDGHPSVPMVAPILAVAEREEASGQDVLTAYVAGFETQAAVADSVKPGHYEAGWHATATIGTFGAAAAVAWLLDLPAAGVERALSIAASTPAGLKRNFGSMTKPIHAGQAARSGTTAALLAAEGVTADSRAIDGDGGFVDLYRGTDEPAFGSEPDRTGRAERSDDRFALGEQGVDVKKYPCCYYTHAAIHAAIEMSREHDLEPDVVRSVTVEASRGAADALQHDQPENPLEAKFSMPYAIAHAIVHGGAGLAAFEPDRLSDEAVDGLRRRVTLETDDDRPYDSNGARVRIMTIYGTSLERYQERPPGTHEEPLSRAELREKFRACGRRAAELGDDVDAIHASFDDLRDLEDVGSLLDRC